MNMRMIKQMSSKIFTLFLIILGYLVSGCATIINGSTENIQIAVSKPEAKVYINDTLIGISEMGKNIEAEIPKKGAIAISIEHSSCEKEYYQLRRTIDPTTFLGLLLDGGIFSILIVDILGTNAFVKAEQSFFEFELDCKDN